MFGKSKTQEESKEPQQLIPFVGRETELRYLHQALNTVIETKTPKFILIEGDFGVGKTAFLNHFLAHIFLTHPSVMIGRGTCASEREMCGLMPFGELLENLVQTGSHAKIIDSNWVDFVKNVAPAWISIVPVIGSAVAAGVQTTVELQKVLGRSGCRQENVFVQFTNAILKLAEQHPVIVFLDDLQWADISSLDLLVHLARHLKVRAILFLCAYRPEAKESGLNAEQFNELRVKILRPDTGSELEMHEGIDVAAYLQQRYPRHAFSSELIKQVQTTTDGHPLFVNQLFSLWEETGVITATPDAENNPIWKLAPDAELNLAAVPSNIQVVLERRLQLMGDVLRKIVTSASVEGEEFSAQVVAQLSKCKEDDVYDLLGSLEHRYWLIQEHETKEFGETILDMYRFIHRFFRDYIYAQLDAGKRRNLHRAVGDSLETLCHNNPEPISGQLACHFREARQPKKAAKYALMAAQVEQSHYACIEGEEWCDFGIKRLENLPVDEEISKLKVDLLDQSGDGYYKSGKYPKAEQRYRAALSLAHEIQAKPEQIAEIYFKLADTCEGEGYPPNKLIKLIEEGQKILTEYDIPFNEAHVKLGWMFGVAHWRKGENISVIEYLPKLLIEARKLLQTDTLKFIIARIFNLLASVFTDVCRYNEAIPNYKKAIELLEEIGEEGFAAGYSANLAETLRQVGKFEEGLPLTSKAIEITSKIGALDDLQFSKGTKGSLLLDMERIPDALRELEEAKRIAEQSGACWYIPILYADLSRAYLSLGNLEKSYQYAMDSLSEAEKNQDPGDISYALDVLGQVEIAHQDWTSAEQNFNKSISLYGQIGDCCSASITRYHFADALLQQGKPVQAEALLRQAMLTFQDLKLEHQIRKVQQLLSKGNGA